jgi:hypothetical protein
MPWALRVWPIGWRPPILAPGPPRRSICRAGARGTAGAMRHAAVGGTLTSDPGSARRYGAASRADVRSTACSRPGGPRAAQRAALPPVRRASRWPDGPPADAAPGSHGPSAGLPECVLLLALLVRPAAGFGGLWRLLGRAFVPTLGSIAHLGTPFISGPDCGTRHRRSMGGSTPNVRSPGQAHGHGQQAECRSETVAGHAQRKFYNRFYN